MTTQYVLNCFIVFCCLCFRKNALQPRIQQQLELPQLTIRFSLAELLFAAYVGTSWLQSSPCPSRFLDLSVMDDVFNRASGKRNNWFTVYGEVISLGYLNITVTIVSSLSFIKSISAQAVFVFCRYSISTVRKYSARCI